LAKAKTTKKKTTKAPAKASSKAKAKSKKSKEVTMDRREPKKDERRKESVRREKESEPVAEELRQEPRRKVARRRQIDPTTCERDYNNDEIEFMHALDEYKRAAGRMFPTCSEILEVLHGLGYRRLTPEELAKIAPPPVVEELNAEVGDASLAGEAVAGIDSVDGDDDNAVLAGVGSDAEFGGYSEDSLEDFDA